MNIDPKAEQLFVQCMDDCIAAHGGDLKNAYTDVPGIWKIWNEGALNYCQSQIEQLMFAALMFAESNHVNWPTPVWLQTGPRCKAVDLFSLMPQFQFGPYRTDFAIFAKMHSGEEIRIAIECDGHDFHKTKEQTKRDRQRDRYFQRHGWIVLRFTGSEIWADPQNCAAEVMGVVTDCFLEDLGQNCGALQPSPQKARLAKTGYQSPLNG